MTAQPTELPLLPAVLPALRLVAAPINAPPYDDELSTSPVLRLVSPLRRPAGGRPAVAAPTEKQELEAWLAAERTPTSALPATAPFARNLVQAMLEALAGVRPLKQLKRDTTPELYATLEGFLARTPRATGARPSSRAVRSVHVQERPEGIVEVCATVQRGPRTAAVALRLEGLDGRWKCTELSGL